MGQIKQIEVNGTTYDIGLPGNELPLSCELYTVAESVPISEQLLLKPGNQSGVSYHELDNLSSILLKRTEVESEVQGLDPTYKYSIVIAVPDDYETNTSYFQELQE